LGRCHSGSGAGYLFTTTFYYYFLLLLLLLPILLFRYVPQRSRGLSCSIIKMGGLFFYVCNKSSDKYNKSFLYVYNICYIIVFYMYILYVYNISTNKEGELQREQRLGSKTERNTCCTHLQTWCATVRRAKAQILKTYAL
jgi:hypothetical protein